MSRARLSYCGELVRGADPDRFHAALFAPAERREGLFALYAFNHEVAKTAEVVSEPLLGQIRLQWWRESLDGIYAGRPRRHEVLEPLHRAVHAHGLDRKLFDRLIDARERDLEPGPPADIDALLDYAACTGGDLALLALEVLGVRDEVSRRAGRRVGTAWALAGLLRAVRFHAVQKRLYLPGLDPADLFELRASEALRAVTRQVAQAARHELAEARREWRGVAPAARPFLHIGVLADRYLDLLARAGYDPLAALCRLGELERAARLLTAALTRRY